MIINYIRKKSLKSYAPHLIIVTITFWLLYPNSIFLFDQINGRPFEDAFESIWYLDWYQHAVVNLQISPLFNPNIFAPEGWNLGFATLTPIYPFLAIPLTTLVGPVASYNLLILFSTLFSIYGIFYLTKEIGGNSWGAALAGLAFSFYPQRVVFFAGQLNLLLGSMWLPWLLLALIRAHKQPQNRIRYTAYAAIATSMSIAGSWHFIFLTGATLLLFLLFYLLPLIKKEWRSWQRPLFLFLIINLFLIGPFFINAFLIRASLGETNSYSFGDINHTSVNLERLLLPSALNPLFWELTRTTYPLTNGQNGVVNFGYLTLFLTLVFLRFAPSPPPYIKKSFIAIFLISLTLMLGTMINISGTPLVFHIPSPTFKHLLPKELIFNEYWGIPLPAFLLYKLIPPFRSFHHFGRWGLIAMLTLAPMAGLGFTHLLTKIKNRRKEILLILLTFSLFLIEFNTQPVHNTTSITEMERNVDQWLAAQPTKKLLIEYPLDYSMKGHALYYATQHKQQIVHGYFQFPPTTFINNLPTLNEWPAEETLDLLQELGVTYILIDVMYGDKNFITETLPILEANPRLQLIDSFEERIGPVQDIYLFELKAK